MKNNNPKENNIKRSINIFKINVFLSIILATILLILLNFCASQIYVRYHYDPLIPQGLSQESINVLRETKGELTIISIFERSHPFRKPARRLLKEYQELSKQIPQLTINTKIIDANLDIVETEEILKEYKDVEINSIVIIKGSEHYCIPATDLSGNPTESKENHSNPAAQFIGESVCTLAIHKLLHTKSSKIYFLAGHGEYDPTNASKHTGASNFAKLLDVYDNEIKVIQLDNGKQIPKDCDVLIIAGPTVMFSETEINALSTYLNNGGRALFLLNNHHANGLGSLLNLWNIQLIPSNQSPFSSISTTIYNQHEITKQLTNIAITFSSPCYLEPASTMHLTTKELADKPQFTPLIFTDPTNNQNPTPNVIAAAINLGSANELGEKQNTRIVVCGDASIISNATIGHSLSGNKHFLFSAIEWLKEGDNTNKMIPAYTTILNSGIPSDKWSALTIRLAIFLPLVILLLGLFVISPILKRI